MFQRRQEVVLACRWAMCARGTIVHEALDASRRSGASNERCTGDGTPHAPGTLSRDNSRFLLHKKTIDILPTYLYVLSAPSSFFKPKASRACWSSLFDVRQGSAPSLQTGLPPMPRHGHGHSHTVAGHQQVRGAPLLQCCQSLPAHCLRQTHSASLCTGPR